MPMSAAGMSRAMISMRFTLIEARDLNDAMRVAAKFPDLTGQHRRAPIKELKR